MINFNLVIEFLASFLIWFLFLGLIVLWLSDGPVTREQVLHAVFAFVLAWFVGEILKNIFHTPRPFEIDGRTALTFMPVYDPGFPSGHTASSFALATTIWLHDRKVGAIFLMIALLVGIGRVLAHVHYPIDIIGGVILGVVIALIIEKVHFKLRS